MEVLDFPVGSKSGYELNTAGATGADRLIDLAKESTITVLRGLFSALG